MGRARGEGRRSYPGRPAGRLATPVTRPTGDLTGIVSASIIERQTTSLIGG